MAVLLVSVMWLHFQCQVSRHAAHTHTMVLMPLQSYCLSSLLVAGKAGAPCAGGYRLAGL